MLEINQRQQPRGSFLLAWAVFMGIALCMLESVLAVATKNGNNPAYVMWQNPFNATVGKPMVKPFAHYDRSVIAMSGDGMTAAALVNKFPNQGVLQTHMFAFDKVQGKWKLESEIDLQLSNNHSVSTRNLRVLLSGDGQVAIVVGMTLEISDDYYDAPPAGNNGRTSTTSNSDEDESIEDDPSSHTHVFVFKKSGNSSWSQSQPTLTLIPSSYGESPSMSHNGNRVAIGTAGANGVIILERASNKSYVVGDSVLKGSQESRGNLRTALNRDGSFLAVSLEIQVTHSVVWVYRYEGSTWNLISKLAGPAQQSVFSATGVAISSDGNAVAVTGTSGCSIFALRNNKYRLDEFIALPDPKQEQFTVRAVQFTNDGKRVLIDELPWNPYTGGFYVFDADGSRWVQNGPLVKVAYGGFVHTPQYSAVRAVSDDGTRVVLLSQMRAVLNPDDPYDDEAVTSDVVFLSNMPPPKCRPSPKASQEDCLSRQVLCGELAQPLKWAGPGCRTRSRGGMRPANDGGCQCKGYCAYQCKSACLADTACSWSVHNGRNRCVNTATNTTGAGLARCG